MTEDRNDLEIKRDDLDLVILAERIFSFFRRYRSILIISSIAGLVAGLMLFIISPKRYSSTLLLHSYTLTNTEQINIIENWNELLKKDEYEALSKDFNCSPEILKKVKRISASEIQKLYVQNNPNGFMVEASVSDTAVFDSLQNWIVNGLENGEYIKAKLESRRSNLKQLIQEVNIEIAKLDSTKQNIENSINNNSKSSSSFIIDVSNITGQMISLHEKLIGYEEDLKFTRAVQVLHNFEKFKNPESPKLFKLLILGFIAGFSIGYILSAYKNVKRKIAERNSPQRK